MRKTGLLQPCFILVFVPLWVAGCSGPDGQLAPVEGTVTLDGQPLPDAKVEFDLQPDLIAYGKTEGSTSYGKTDANGRYQLKYTHEKNGALVGKHVVRITTRGMTIDAQGKEVPVPERVPPQYNLSSALTAEVQSGANTINFELESSPAGE